MWETGQRIPNQEQIQQIADACQVPVGYLLGTEQPDFPRWARQHFRDMLSEHDI